MGVRLPPRIQGDIGERAAAAWLLNQGHTVAYPFGHSPDWDLVAEIDGTIYRIQVKTSTQLVKGRWSVTLCTRGGNRSWNGIVKRIDPSRYDYLFVLVGDGRQWFLPSQDVEGQSGLTLGSTKYERFEVEPGQPIAEQAKRGAARSKLSEQPRRDVRVVKGGAL